MNGFGHMEISELRPYARAVVDNLRLITASKEEAQIREEKEQERRGGSDHDDDDDDDGEDGEDAEGGGGNYGEERAGGRASLARARGRERWTARGGGSVSQGRSYDRSSLTRDG